jgi:murein DD-endopeptidase
MTTFNKYINIPFKHHGRDFNGCDCFGILKLMYTNELNINLPDYEYSFDWNQTHNHIIDNIRNNWIEVNPPYKKYDCLVFCTTYNSKIANHIGVYIGDNKFIHIQENQFSRIERLDGFYSKKLYKTIRYKELY